MWWPSPALEPPAGARQTMGRPSLGPQMLPNYTVSFDPFRLGGRGKKPNLGNFLKLSWAWHSLAPASFSISGYWLIFKNEAKSAMVSQFCLFEPTCVLTWWTFTQNFAYDQWQWSMMVKAISSLKVAYLCDHNSIKTDAWISPTLSIGQILWDAL